MFNEDRSTQVEVSGSEPPSLVIDGFLEGSILRQPSSAGQGWRHLAVERRTIPPSELPELAVTQHFLILWDTQVAEGESAYRGDRFSPYRKLPNTLTSCHPGTRPATRNRSSHEVVVAAIDPRFVSGLEMELDSLPTGSFEGLYGMDDSDLRTLLLLLLKESEAGAPCGPLYSESLATALVNRLAYGARRQKMPKQPATGMLTGRVLGRVVERMRVDLSADLDLATLAAESGYSRAHFLRTFKAATGQTPHRYLKELRLQKARDLLVRDALPLIEVAAACGFSSHSHMTSSFHARFGVAPNRYRLFTTRAG